MALRQLRPEPCAPYALDALGAEPRIASGDNSPTATCESGRNVCPSRARRKAPTRVTGPGPSHRHLASALTNRSVASILLVGFLRQPATQENARGEAGKPRSGRRSQCKSTASAPYVLQVRRGGVGGFRHPRRDRKSWSSTRLPRALERRSILRRRCSSMFVRIRSAPLDCVFSVATRSSAGLGCQGRSREGLRQPLRCDEKRWCGRRRGGDGRGRVLEGGTRRDLTIVGLASKGPQA